MVIYQKMELHYWDMYYELILNGVAMGTKMGPTYTILFAFYKICVLEGKFCLCLWFWWLYFF